MCRVINDVNWAHALVRIYFYGLHHVNWVSFAEPVALPVFLEFNLWTSQVFGCSTVAIVPSTKADYSPTTSLVNRDRTSGFENFAMATTSGTSCPHGGGRSQSTGKPVHHATQSSVLARGSTLKREIRIWKGRGEGVGFTIARIRQQVRKACLWSCPSIALTSAQMSFGPF